MRKAINLITLLVCSLFVVTSCSQNGSKKATELAVQQKFTTPAVPSMLTSPEQRAEFMVAHYWDNFDFADTTLISRTDYTEQAFADFVNILSNVSPTVATKGIGALMKQAAIDKAMYDYFVDVAEKYLYDPNSPMRNEVLYIVWLQNILASDVLTEIEKARPQYQLELALKNRVGHRAIDFEYTTEQGGKARLYSAKGSNLLLFFFRPDCPTCKDTKAYVLSAGIDKMANIIWVNPDIDTHLETIYDLRASPTLYLLSSDKTVLMKDAPIEEIENYLVNSQNAL